MKPWIGLLLAAVGLLLFFGSFAHEGPSAAAGPQTPLAASREEGGRTPVLVELFTSEGCSNCPPADALLARLEKTQPIAGAQIIALKEHVDYWNHLGWRDPYSSVQFSQRQSAYADSFRSDQVYTPQMIVDGRTQFVGSGERNARQAIAQAARAPKATVHLEWKQDPAAAGAIPLEVRVDSIGQATSGDLAEVYLAITEDYLHSDVLRGENAGSKFDHFAVVRELKRIGNADPRAATAFAAQPVVTVAVGWKRENLRAVVFVQESRSRRILAAGEISFATR
jgi:hypothetical protein